MANPLETIVKATALLHSHPRDLEFLIDTMVGSAMACEANPVLGGKELASLFREMASAMVHHRSRLQALDTVDLSKAHDTIMEADDCEMDDMKKPVLGLVEESLVLALQAGPPEPFLSYFRDLHDQIQTAHRDLSTYRADLKAVYDGLSDFLA